LEKAGCATDGKADLPDDHDLSAQPLSLRFNHEGFCDELYVYRKTPPLVLFADFQAAFLIAG
jgi:hypothetical protein